MNFDKPDRFILSVKILKLHFQKTPSLPFNNSIKAEKSSGDHISQPKFSNFSILSFSKKEETSQGKYTWEEGRIF